MSPLFIISTLLSIALAQTTTITVPFAGYEDTTIHASVISAKPAATVLALACPPGTDSDNCGLFPQQLLTYGPSTYVMDMSEPGDDDFTMTADCSFGSTTALCKESASGSEANFPGSSTETYSGDGGWTGVTHLPVTITAGAEKLAASVEASPTPNGSSKGIASAAATTGGSANATSAIPTATGKTASSSSAVPPPGNTGAAVRSTFSNSVLIGAGAGVFAAYFL